MLFAASTVLFALSPAHAAVSLRLNSAGVISAATTLSVDGLITSTGDWKDLKGAQVCISYDPTKVTLSNAQPATGWTYEIAVDHTDTHIYQALFTTQAASLTTGGPIFTFTVTPVNGPVDTSDCSVLELHGGNGLEAWPVCELVSGDYYSVWIQDACPDDNALYLGDNFFRPDNGGMGLMSLSAEVDPCDGTPIWLPPITAGMMQDTLKALKLSGGLSTGTPDEIGDLDLTGDGSVSIEDAVCLLRTPKPEGWYEFEGNSQHTGYAPDAMSASPSEIWKTASGLPMPAGLTPVNAFIPGDERIPPSPVVVPNPNNPLSRLVYAVVNAKDTNGKYISVLYRIEERPTNPSSPLITYAKIPSDVNGASFAAVGTPLVVGGRLIVTGNSSPFAGSDGSTSIIGYVYALDAETLQPVWTGSSNPRILTGKTISSPVFSPKVTEYTSQECGVRTCVGGVILIACDGTYTEAGGGQPIAGFLNALSLSNGRNVWGSVDTDGGLVANTAIRVDDPGASFPGTSPGGLPPFGGAAPGNPSTFSAFPSAYSAPAVDMKGNKAYINGVVGDMNTRGLRKGGYWWNERVFDDTIGSTVCLFDDVLYYGGEGASAVAMRTDQTVEWKFNYLSAGIFNVYASPAVDPDTSTVVLGDAYGQLFGVGVKSQQPPDPTIKWQPTVTTNGEAIFSSALVTPNAAGGSLAFVGGDDKLVHIVNLANGTSLGSLGDSSNPNGTFDGYVRASVAGMDGRVYVLVHGHVNEATGAVDFPTKVYCFGGP